MTVELLGINHTFPNDIDVLLVDPTGDAMIILSDTAALDWVNLDLTLSDSASSHIGNNTTSGTYLPTDAGFCAGAFPSPAPAGPYGKAGPCGTDTLASEFLNGSVASGLWSLYVLDDQQTDSGSITGGWALTFDVADVPEPSSMALIFFGGAFILALIRRRAI
jgi:PEP-CTERM motif